MSGIFVVALLSLSLIVFTEPVPLSRDPSGEKENNVDHSRTKRYVDHKFRLKHIWEMHHPVCPGNDNVYHHFQTLFNDSRNGITANRYVHTFIITNDQNSLVNQIDSILDRRNPHTSYFWFDNTDFHPHVFIATIHLTWHNDKPTGYTHCSCSDSGSFEVKLTKSTNPYTPGNFFVFHLQSSSVH